MCQIFDMAYKYASKNVQYKKNLPRFGGRFFYKN